MCIIYIVKLYTKRRYAFRSNLYNYFYSYILFFQSKRITKKTVKVIEDEICSKIFEMYMETEKVVLVKFVKAIPFSRSHFFQRKALLLVETILFLGETIPFSGSYFFQRKAFHLLEVVFIGGGRFFQSKRILLVKAIPFGENISCSENIACNGSHSIQWKSLLLVETTPFSGSRSF